MLADVVGFVRRDFARSRCPATVHLGIEYLAEHDEALRVVFVPTRDRFRPPQQIKGSPSFPTASGINPQPILIRDVGFDVHMWAAAPTLDDPSLQVAADYAILQSLVNQVCLSITRCVQGAWRQSGGETKQDTAWAKQGQAYVLSATVEMPVVTTDFRGAVDCTAKTWDEVLASFHVDVDVLGPDGSVIQSVPVEVDQP